MKNYFFCLSKKVLKQPKSSVSVKQLVRPARLCSASVASRTGFSLYSLEKGWIGLEKQFAKKMDTLIRGVVRGGPEGARSNFADHLTLFKPGRSDYPQPLLLAPPPNVFHLPASLCCRGTEMSQIWVGIGICGGGVICPLHFRVRK